MATAQTKVLLMGPKDGGKTSMRSVVFANYLPRETVKMGPSVDITRSHVRLLGSLTVAMWDCGMQVDYVHGYLNKSRQNTFSNALALIYVCDATSLARSLEEDSQTGGDIEDLREVMLALQEQSPGAKAFVLMNKADLLPQRDEITQTLLEDVAAELRRTPGTQEMDIQFFVTTIWDDSLFHAWSNILQRLVPNVELLRTYLASCLTEDIEELVVLEAATYLTVSHVGGAQHRVADDGTPAAARVTNALKGFKLSCGKSRRSVASFSLVTGDSLLVLDRFTTNTMIMAVFKDTPLALARLAAQSIRAGVAPFLEAHGQEGLDLLAIL